MLTPAKLRAIRKRLKLSRAKFAKALGYKDPMSIYRMEKKLSPVTARAELAVMQLMMDIKLKGDKR